MPTTLINSITLPESTSKPVVHEDLIRITNQMVLGDVMRFASATERDTVFTTLAISPPTGSVCYLADVARHFYYTGAAWTAAVKGQVLEQTRVTSSGSITTTETVVDSFTFTAVAGCNYRVSYESSGQSSVVNDLIKVQMRYKAGSTPDITGTIFTSKILNADIAGKGALFSITKALPVLTPGPYVVVATMLRNSGSGNVVSFGSAEQEDVIRLDII